MKYLLLALLLLATGWLLPAAAQTYPVDTLVKTGPLSRRVNLVILPDGYQTIEMPLFRTRAQALMTSLFAQTPFKEYQNYFNVFTVQVPSTTSGAKHPKTAPDCGTVPVATATTTFNSTYDYGNIHRLLVPQSSVSISSVLAQNFPSYDQVLVLVNAADYGGSGGQWATSSAHASAGEIVIHEIGHSFAGLADEYWAGAQYARERPNMTQNADPATTRWAAWLNSSGIGLYPHTTDPSWLKPHQNCKMQYLGSPFCAVCRETLVERFHTLVAALQGYTPAAATFSSPAAGPQFSLNLVLPQPNTLRVTWTRDGTVVARNRATLSLTPAQLGAPGTHLVQATVLDTTALTRATQHATQHLYTVQWSVTQTALGTQTSAALAATYEVATFPNPTANELRLRYTLPRPGPVTLTVLDALGRTVGTRRYPQQAAGAHEVPLQVAELGMAAAGVYQLQLDMDGVVLSRPLVRE